MTNDLAWQLKTNEALWQRWLEFGLAPGDEFEVEFHFYTAKESVADRLIEGFAKTGLTARKEVSRTLFILKGWHVTVPISQSWTLDVLNDQTRQFCRLAAMTQVAFEGCGAYMPSQKQRP